MPSGEGRGPSSGSGESDPTSRKTRIASGTPFNQRSPASSALISARFIDSQADSPMRTSPGPATASMREAMFTGSPKTSPPDIRTSPRWTATRACSRRSGGTDASNRRTRSIRAAAQSTALVGESKATRKVPPICLTRRPPKRRNAGSTSAACSRSILWDSSQVSAPRRSAYPQRPAKTMARFRDFTSEKVGRGSRSGTPCGGGAIYVSTAERPARSAPRSRRGAGPSRSSNSIRS